MRVWLLLLSLLALPSCGGGGVERVAVETVTKGAVNFFNRDLDLKGEAVKSFTDWAHFSSNVGGLLLILGVVCFLWINKQVGSRLFLNGLIFFGTGLMIDWIGNNALWALLLCGLIYVVLNPKWAEKVLARFGIRWDMNNDNMIGSERIEKDPFNQEETEIIEHSDGLLPPDDRPMEDITHG